MDFLNSSDGTINGANSKAYSITLTSTNGALKFVNFEPGDLLTLVVKEDASGSNYTLTFPASVKWQAGAAPSRDTTANAVSVFTFSYDGTNWRDTGGNAKGLPSRTQSAALGTILGVGAVVLTLIVSGGNGQRPGAAGLSDIAQYKTGSGSAAVTVAKMDASGSFALGQSGALAVGTPTLNARGTDAKFFVDKSGNTTAKGTLSGKTLNVNVPAAGANQPSCRKPDGTLGYMIRTATGFLQVTCN